MSFDPTQINFLIIRLNWLNKKQYNDATGIAKTNSAQLVLIL